MVGKIREDKGRQGCQRSAEGKRLKTFLKLWNKDDKKGPDNN